MIHLASQKVNVLDVADQEKIVTIFVYAPEAFMDHNVKRVSTTCHCIAWNIQ